VTFFDHPEQMLAVDDTGSTDEITRHLTGTTGSSVTFDGSLVHTEIAFFDRKSIDGMDAGVIEISPGYQVRVVPVTDAMDLESVASSPGIWKGQPYTHVQREIRGNHVTQLKHGRQGASVSLRLDSNLSIQKDAMEPETITLMGQTFEDVPASLVAVLKALMATGALPMEAPTPEPAPGAPAPAAPSENAMDKQERAELQAKLDVALEKVAELEKAKESLPETVRKDLLFEVEAATIVGRSSDTFSGKPRREIMETVLSEKLDGVDLKDRTDEYVQARFDILVEELAKKPDHGKLNQLRTESTTPISKKDLDDAHKKTLDSWRARGTGPLLLNKKGA
jgi:hypothetical protein